MGETRMDKGSEEGHELSAQGQLEGMGIVSKNGDGQGPAALGKDKNTGWTAVLGLEKG